MALTPEEIENKTFPIDLRGYDKETVHAFLEEVARSYKDLLTSDNRAAETSGAERGPDALDAFAEQLSAVLRAATTEAEKLVAQAREEAAIAIEQGSADSEQVRAEAARELNRSKELREAAEQDAAVAENVRLVAEEEAAKILADAEAQAHLAASSTRAELAVALGDAMGGVRQASKLLDGLAKTLADHDLLAAPDELNQMGAAAEDEADSG